MGALTKSEMAERLYEELGLNKREAKEIVELFFEEIRRRASGKEGHLAYHATRVSVPAAIQRPGKKSPSLPAAWSPSAPARSSRPG